MAFRTPRGGQGEEVGNRLAEVEEDNCCRVEVGSLVREEVEIGQVGKVGDSRRTEVVGCDWDKEPVGAFGHIGSKVAAVVGRCCSPPEVARIPPNLTLEVGVRDRKDLDVMVRHSYLDYSD